MPHSSGSLFLAGGGPLPYEVVDRFIRHCGGSHAPIVVLPLASEDPNRGHDSVALLRHRGARNVVLFDHRRPTTADLDELRMKLAGAKGLWMPGGAQGRFVNRLGRRWIAENIRGRVRRGMHIFGTSAGAMVCSETMITGPGGRPDTAHTGPGMGLTTWIVDTHFAERNREPRLRHALRATGRSHGVGINESDWIVIQDDRIQEMHGHPTVLQLRPALPTIA